MLDGWKAMGCGRLWGRIKQGIKGKVSAMGDVAGVVLAGGLSRRLGRDKAVERISGEPMIVRCVRRLAPLVSEIVVVVNTAERGERLPLPPGVRVAVDMYPDSGSLGGIFTGISAIGREWGVVVACDMPFVNVDLVGHMLGLRDGQDLVAPMIGGRAEPTHALYSKACLPHMERWLQAGDLKITRFYDDVRVRYVGDDEVDRFDPERLSFFNINTAADLSRAVAIAAQEDSG